MWNCPYCHEHMECGRFKKSGIASAFLWSETLKDWNNTKSEKSGMVKTFKTLEPESAKDVLVRHCFFLPQSSCVLHGLKRRFEIIYYLMR